MELDLTDSPLNLKDITPRELEEILEDPFGIRLLPDVDREDGENRYYTLGRTVQDRHLFIAFWTDGKIARVCAAREMTESELRFYQRSYGEIK
ncbi:BrnT family toxin [Verrucomicrobiaceae bacterium R5-34]|uniref:BrnT family toxin n=1 Tax=Oceaniferula flava TaxID=2800421 RepID=A0AAE2S9L3_9BACT|nr:BrnT family toxin [Oceaniferula flavus]MBK1829416.1 BrnT family toxin [Verrucomicrobiaceae bacterium R5-34]MBK1853643.1 BrnT family toxin [Oceaniferula flavus]MBM1134948.1 BrnT family toxin [Oceaniferula flavus]